MQKLNHIFNSLHSFDKYFLEIFYRLKYKIDSKRFLLLNLLLDNKCGDVESLNELTKDSAALAQNKRRLRFDIESMLLLRILNPLNSKTSARITCKRNLLLSRFYQDKGLINEASLKLKKAWRLIEKHDLLNERIEYYFLIKDLFASKDLSNQEGILHDTLSAVKSIEFQLLNDLELIAFKKKNLEILAKEPESSYCNSKFPNEKLLGLQRNKLKEWRKKNYPKAKKYLEDQCAELKKNGANGFTLRLECLLQLIQINIYCGYEKQNEKLVEIIEDEFHLTKKQESEFLELQFTNHFLLKNFSVCDPIIIDLQKCHISKDNLEIQSKIKFFELLLAFVRKDFNQVSMLLQSETALFTCENSLSINIRLLEIYSLLLQDNMDLCKYKLEALRQAIMRKKDINRSRYLFIERLLYSLLTKNTKLEITLRKYNAQKKKCNDRRFIKDIEGFELFSIEEFFEVFKQHHIKEYTSV
jgi:hypothetical protein